MALKNPDLWGQPTTEFIVRASNCHEELVRVLSDLVAQFDVYRAGWLGDGWKSNPIAWSDRIGLQQDLEDARAILQKAQAPL